MGVAKTMKRQFQPSMFKLDHHSASDFYLSCWQRNRSVLPLLCIRAAIFLGCLAILLASLILTGMEVNIGFWFIFLTHWGLILINVASGLALAVSLTAYMKGPMEASFDLPLSIKFFWAAYDTAITIAVFITIYFYAFLAFEADIDYVVNEVLDVFIHAMNSVLMLALMLTSRVPARMLHFIYPCCFGIVYLLFSVIYYFADGPDLFGLGFIYPMLDWSKPGQTMIMVAVTTIAMIILHWFIVAIAAGRDALTRNVRRDSANFTVTNLPPEYH